MKGRGSFAVIKGTLVAGMAKDESQLKRMQNPEAKEAQRLIKQHRRCTRVAANLHRLARGLNQITVAERAICIADNRMIIKAIVKDTNCGDEDERRFKNCISRRGRGTMDPTMAPTFQMQAAKLEKAHKKQRAAAQL